jgi:hypothetical protein
MHLWVVRVALNFAALAAGGAIGYVGFSETGSPISFAFSVLIYFFLAWGLAVHATQGPARVEFRSYVRPLLLAYWILGVIATIAIMLLLAVMSLSLVNPNFTIDFQLISSLIIQLITDPESLLYILGGGLAISIVLLIPPVVAIVDRPPPGGHVGSDQEGSAGPNGQPGGSVDPLSVNPVISASKPRAVETNPDPSDSNSLEELFGIEPRREG